MMAIPLSKGFSGCATTRGVEWNNEKAEEGRGKSEQVGRIDTQLGMTDIRGSLHFTMARIGSAEF